MCLAVPGKILSVDCSLELKTAKVDFGGLVKQICVEWHDVVPGDYVLVHAGMVISIIDNEEAERSLQVWNELIEKLDEMEVSAE